MSDPAERPTHLCAHLAAEPTDYHVWFTGQGRAMYWVCAACAKAHPEPPASLVAYTPAFWDAHGDDLCWDGTCGMPAVLTRASTLSFQHEDIARDDVAGWIAVQPRPGSSHWWVLLADRLALWRPAQGALKAVVDLSELDFEIDAEAGLRVSPDGRYAAVFQTSNRLARIYDLTTGAQTARVDRGDYRPENSHFPIAFFMVGDRCLLVAATAWNRLDVHDPATGEVLTARIDPADADDADDDTTARLLDYFHGRLSVSPDGRRVVDRGWVWHPVGVVRAWDLHAWLDNPWECEDGPSAHWLADRGYFWDGPACWIDGETVAIWGWGHDDEALVPAALLFDAPSGKPKFWFPGPEARRPGIWPPKRRAASFFFDVWLFSVSDDAGLTAWDVATGERVCAAPDLTPIHYHPDARSFLSLTERGVRLSRLIG